MLFRSGDKVRPAGLSTGDTGAVRAEAREAIEQVIERLKGEAGLTPGDAVPLPADAPLEEGSRVTIGALGLEGIILEMHDRHADVDVRGKRLRAALRDLRAIGGTPASPKVRVNVDLQPRGEGLLSELNVIGNTVDEALTRVEKFLDESTVTDLRELRIVQDRKSTRLNSSH